MYSDQNNDRMADYLEENESIGKITDEKNFPSAIEPTVKIGTENSYRCFADIKTDIEKFFQKYSFSLISEKENEIDYYKKETGFWTRQLRNLRRCRLTHPASNGRSCSSLRASIRCVR